MKCADSGIMNGNNNSTRESGYLKNIWGTERGQNLNSVIIFKSVLCLFLC